MAPAAAEMMEMEADGDEACVYTGPDDDPDDDNSSVTATQLANGDGASASPNKGLDGGRGLGGRAPGLVASSNSGSKSRVKGKDCIKKKCRLCTKWFLEEEFALNSPYCKEDKNAVDNLAKQAATQNHTAFFKDIRGSEEKLKVMVQKYKKMCPFDKSKGKRGMFSYVASRE